eukprot:TRINITY_DN17627_c0_g1_i1.p1 TRINITY_DN17627_c0_g1~~TRINITY_DN17627_c0_g1_i1.p1  ORF type:complete len:219 (+),score=27.70 TRINITY_DN17627_c0_g1_i1:43-699(+)
MFRPSSAYETLDEDKPPAFRRLSREAVPVPGTIIASCGVCRTRYQKRMDCEFFQCESCGAMVTHAMPTYSPPVTQQVIHTVVVQQLTERKKKKKKKKTKQKYDDESASSSESDSESSSESGSKRKKKRASRKTLEEREKQAMRIYSARISGHHLQLARRKLTCGLIHAVLRLSQVLGLPSNLRPQAVHPPILLGITLISVQTSRSMCQGMLRVCRQIS